MMRNRILALPQIPSPKIPTLCREENGNITVEKLGRLCPIVANNEITWHHSLLT